MVAVREGTGVKVRVTTEVGVEERGNEVIIPTEYWAIMSASTTFMDPSLFTSALAAINPAGFKPIVYCATINASIMSTMLLPFTSPVKAAREAEAKSRQHSRIQKNSSFLDKFLNIEILLFLNIIIGMQELFHLRIKCLVVLIIFI